MVRVIDKETLERELCHHSKEYDSAVVLGSGLFGTTTKYRTIADGKMVAIKAIPSFLISKFVSKARLLREMLNLSKIHHPAVVSPKGVIFPDTESPSHFKFVSNLMERESFADSLLGFHNILIRNDTQKMIVAFGIAAGMQYLHYNGYTHAYLSPNNIVFNVNGEPKVVDFWYPRLIDGDYFQGMVSEREIYVAPERFTSTHSSKVDVFAYGKILWYIATSDKRSYRGSHMPRHDFDMMMDTGLDLPNIRDSTISADIQPRLKQLVQACCDSDPAARPTFDAILAAFYSDTNLLFPNTDLDKFDEYRRRVLFQFIHEQCNVSYFDVGPLPVEQTRKFKKLMEYADGGNVKAMFRVWRLTNDMKYLRMAAEKGNRSAQYELSTILSDEKEADKYLKMAADQDYTAAMRDYGTKYNELELIKKAALKGDIDAQITYYEKTKDVVYLHLAVSNESPEAYFMLAELQAHGQRLSMKEKYDMIAQNGSTHEENVKRLEEQIRKVPYKDLYAAIRNYTKSAAMKYKAAMKKLDDVKKSAKTVAKCQQLFKQNKDQERIDNMIMWGIMVVLEYADCGREPGEKRDAIGMLKSAARLLNSADAQFQLYIIYNTCSDHPRIGIVDSELPSREYLKAAARQGHPTAATFYARMVGPPVTADTIAPEIVSEALRYYRHAAQTGDPIGITSYAAFAHETRFDPLAAEESACYYKAGSDRGNEQAQYMYAQLAEDGAGMNMDLPAAVYLYKLGSKQGRLDCMVSLADIYRNEDSLKVSDKEITKRYLIAGANGSGYSMCMAGKRYELGVGVAKDYTQAALCHKWGAILGDSISQFKYANMLKNGSNVEKDIHEAIHFYTLSSDQDNVGAKKALAGFYINTDIIKARNLLKEAASLGDADARFKYGELLLSQKMPRKQTVIEEAIDNFAMAAEDDNIDAILRLAEIYEKGELVDRDVKMACELYGRATTITGDKKYLEHATEQLQLARQERVYSMLAARDTAWPEDDLLPAFNKSSGGNRLQSLLQKQGDYVQTLASRALKSSNPKDIACVINHLKKSAKDGNAMAQRELGRIHMSEAFRDFGLAEHYLQSAVTNGIDEAICELGDLYALQKKIDLAQSLYKMAEAHNCKLGSRESVLRFEGEQGLLALIENPETHDHPLDAYHLLGEVCECSDLDRAYRIELTCFYRKHAEDGNMYAQHNYGMLLDANALENAGNKSLQWIKKAADQGVQFSQYKYASLLIEKNLNLTEALRYLKIGLEQNYTRSIIELIRVHESGIGVEKSDADALSMAKKGAESNDPTCIYHVARLTMKMGVNVDYKEVTELLEKSMRGGNAEAALLNGKIHEKMSDKVDCPVPMVKAALCFKFAAERSLPKGWYHYGLCLKYGRGVQMDTAEARKYLQKATAAGVKKALPELAVF